MLGATSAGKGSASSLSRWVYTSAGNGVSVGAAGDEHPILVEVGIPLDKGTGGGGGGGGGGLDEVGRDQE